MKKSDTLIFFGNERLATGVVTEAPVLKALVANNYNVAAIVSSPAKARSRKIRDLEVAVLAKSHNIPFLAPDQLDDITDQLSSYTPSAGILVAYGKILPAHIINLFPRGVINIHPSLLPSYRGPTPIETAILDGVSKTGVSLMQLTPQLDSGPVFSSKEIDIADSQSKQDLANKLLEAGRDLLIANLPSILDGSLKACPQDETKAIYTELISKNDGFIDWNKPAQRLEHEVRAYQGWPKSQAQVLGRDIIITKARVVKAQTDGQLVIKCTHGWLEIEQLVAPSGRTMSGSDFLRGYLR